MRHAIRAVSVVFSAALVGCGGNGDANTGSASGAGESTSSVTASSTTASATTASATTGSTTASSSAAAAGGGGASGSTGPGGSQAGGGGASSTGEGGFGGATSNGGGGSGGTGGTAGGAGGGGGAAPVDCPTAPTSRTVGAHRSAVPSLVWWGGGYTVIIDEVVTEPSTLNLTFEKTDATGARLAGPTAILPNDGTIRFWPRVAFSGSQYGIAYLEGAGRTPTFLRTDASLNFIAGSKTALGATNGGAVAIAWSNHRWAITWTQHDATGEIVVLQRFDASGAPVGQLEQLGFGYISENGVPMIPTATGWAILSTGYPARVIEVDASGASRSVDLPFNGGRGSLASDGIVYAVAVEATNPANPGTFAFVQVGGGLVPGSVSTINGSYVEFPNTIWTGTEFIVSWTQTTASAQYPLLRSSVAPGSSPGMIFGVPFTTQNAGGSHQLAAGSCGWAVVYDTPVNAALDYLEVQP